MISTQEFIANVGIAGISPNVPFLVVLLHRSEFSSSVFLSLHERSRNSNPNTHEGFVIYRGRRPPGFCIIIIMPLVLKLISNYFWDLFFDFWMLQAVNIDNTAYFCCSSGWYGGFGFE